MAEPGSGRRRRGDGVRRPVSRRWIPDGPEIASETDFPVHPELSTSVPLAPLAGHPPLITQLVRFALTGVLAAAVDFGLLNLLMWAGLGHTPAKACSFVAGTATSYLINRRWTFRAASSARRFLAVMLLYGLTFVLQVGLWAVLYPLLGGTALPEVVVRMVAFVIAQGVATVVNFVVQRVIIFRHRPQPATR